MFSSVPAYTFSGNSQGHFPPYPYTFSSNSQGQHQNVASGQPENLPTTVSSARTNSRKRFTQSFGYPDYYEQNPHDFTQGHLKIPKQTSQVEASIPIPEATARSLDTRLRDKLMLRFNNPNHCRPEIQDWETLKTIDQYTWDKLSIPDIEGNTLLHIACAKGLSMVVSYLLAKQIPVDEINKPNVRGETAMHLCCASVHFTSVLILQQLFSVGGDINKPDEKGDTALHKICAQKVNTRQDECRIQCLLQVALAAPTTKTDLLNKAKFKARDLVLQNKLEEESQVLNRQKPLPPIREMLGDVYNYPTEQNQQSLLQY